MNRREIDVVNLALVTLEAGQVEEAMALLRDLLPSPDADKELWLVDPGPGRSRKIEVINAVRWLLGIGLVEAKEICDALPGHPYSLGVRPQEHPAVKELIATGAVVEWR